MLLRSPIDATDAFQRNLVRANTVISPKQKLGVQIK